MKKIKHLLICAPLASCAIISPIITSCAQKQTEDEQNAHLHWNVSDENFKIDIQHTYLKVGSVEESTKYYFGLINPTIFANDLMYSILDMNYLQNLLFYDVDVEVISLNTKTHRVSFNVATKGFIIAGYTWNIDWKFEIKNLKMGPLYDGDFGPFNYISMPGYQDSSPQQSKQAFENDTEWSMNITVDRYIELHEKNEYQFNSDAIKGLDISSAEWRFFFDSFKIPCCINSYFWEEVYIVEP